MNPLVSVVLCTSVHVMMLRFVCPLRLCCLQATVASLLAGASRFVAVSYTPSLCWEDSLL